MSPRSQPRDVLAVDEVTDDDEAIGSIPDSVVDQAVGLVRGIRDSDPQMVVDDYTSALSWGEMRTLAVTLAAMVPADVDPARALEWVDLPPREWSAATVVREDGRWQAGSRDVTAARGRGQMARRAADTFHAATAAAGGAR